MAQIGQKIKPVVIKFFEYINGKLVFDSATSPNTFWIKLFDLNFQEGTPVKKLTLTGGKIYSGNVADKFEDAKPFVFLPANTQ